MLAHRIRDEGYAAVAEDLEERFSSYLTPSGTKDPPEGVPAAARNYFPRTFPGIWPLLGASELPPVGGTPSMGTTGIRLSAVRFGVRIYAPALTRKDRGEEYKDGREAAKRITRAVFSEWLRAFEEDDELSAYDVDLTVDMGDHDRLKNPFYQPNTRENTILWVLAVGISIDL